MLFSCAEVVCENAKRDKSSAARRRSDADGGCGCELRPLVLSLFPELVRVRLDAFQVLRKPATCFVSLPTTDSAGAPTVSQVGAGWNEKMARPTGLRSLQSRGIMSPTRRYGPRPARMSPSLVRTRQVRIGCGVQRWRLSEERRRLCSTGRAVHNHGQTCSEQGEMVHGEPECPLPSCGVAPPSSCARCGSLGFSPRSRPSLLLLA